MDSTDTAQQFEILQRELDRDPKGKRMPRVAIALAAAAAVVVAALVLVDARGDDRTDTPAGPVDTRGAEAVATAYLAAVAAYDARRAESYLADGAGIQLRPYTVDAASTGPHLRWTRAVGFRLLPGRCETESVAAPATIVACAYDAHGLGSDRLDRGPFTGNVLRLTVTDGEIVSGVEEWGSDAFEVTMWEPFTAWLVSNRADEAALMFADSPWAMRPALTERAALLWEQNVDRYVRAVQRGEAY